jgi:hypothetical protein
VDPNLPSEPNLPAEWNIPEELWVSPDDVAGLLKRYNVPIERYAQHLGLNVLAVADYLDGKKGDIRVWMVWPLLMYHYHPESRLIDGRIALPIDKWREYARDHPSRNRPP